MMSVAIVYFAVACSAGVREPVQSSAVHPSVSEAILVPMSAVGRAPGSGSRTVTVESRDIEHGFEVSVHRTQVTSTWEGPQPCCDPERAPNLR